VTAKSGCALVLIIDQDLGFLMWLGELFTELGCQTVPALHCRHALELAQRLELPISTLVVNPDLPGAAKTIKTLVASNPDARVVLIRDAGAAPKSIAAGAPGQGNAPTIVPQMILERPTPGEPISRPAWLARVRKVLLQAHSP
jgi:hypothetical protein